MNAVLNTPKLTMIRFLGLDKLSLPFTSHLLPGAENDVLLETINALADNQDKYYIKSVTGIEPPGRDVAIARTASGGSFQGATDVDRELVVLIGLNPDWENGETAGQLRQQLYSMIYTGYDPKIDVQLVAGILEFAHEYGYVTKFEASMFDANPAVQLTISMLNPTFRAYTHTSYAAGDMSETNPNVYNEGTAETGFQFAVKFTASRSSWFIKVAGDQSIGMTFEDSFENGDVLSVSTIPGQKYVHLKKHRGKVKNKLGILKSGSEWIQLHPGNNHFVVPSKGSSWDWNGKLTFTPHYAGA